MPSSRCSERTWTTPWLKQRKLEFNKELRELSLTQHDEVKSVFPAHLGLLDCSTGQILIDQMFHMPKIIGKSYMSVPAFRRFRHITYHYRTPEKQELWKKAVGNPLHSFLDKNRGRKSEKKGGQQDDKDHYLTTLSDEGHKTI